MAEIWKDEIRAKLISLYEDDQEKFLRIIWFLDQEDRDYNKVDPEISSPMWRTLQAALKSEISFKNYADRINRDAATAENDPQFRQLMRQIYDRMMESSDQELQADAEFQIALIADETTALTGLSSGLARAWSLIPAASRAEALEVLRRLASNYSALSAVDEVVSLANRAGGNVVMIGLAAVALSYACFTNIRRWHRGEISGKRCVKNCLDSLASIGSGVGGGVAGAAIGTLIFPVWGTLIGGILGGVGGAQIAHVISDKLTRYLFDLPVNEAVERSYNFFGVSHRAPNDEINKVFRRKCLSTHPDKGGRAADFVEVQFHMANIKVARGEVM